MSTGQPPRSTARDVIPIRFRSEPSKRTILFVDYAPHGSSNRSADPGSSSKKQKELRSHAAAASAGKRKATIARKEAQQRLSQMIRLGIPIEAVANTIITQRAPPNVLRPSPDAFKQLVELVTEIQGDGVWYLGPVERTSLAHKAIRKTLWDAMVNSVTLFQAAAFVAATHCNSCGLPSTAVHMGSGLIVLRGASFNAVQGAITDATTDSLTPVSIAMLAGWERRYGDPESFQVHMQAWRSLSLPPKALDENHVATLTDLTLETFRAALDERSVASPGGFRIVQSPQDILDLTTLPPGFKIFRVLEPESRSLMELVSQLVRLDVRAADSVLQLRRLSLENLAWSPHHTHSASPSPAHEDAWDPLELRALYHVRAAMISLIALTLRHAADRHRSPWRFDMETALSVHTTSCQHLGSESLLTTKYREIAVWARFILCATSRDPPRDEMMRGFLSELKVTSWEQVRKLLKKHIFNEALFGDRCRAFYRALYLVTPEEED